LNTLFTTRSTFSAGFNQKKAKSNLIPSRKVDWPGPNCNLSANHGFSLNDTHRTTQLANGFYKEVGAFTKKMGFIILFFDYKKIKNWFELLF